MQPEMSSPTSARAADAEERVRMFTKLFSMYPLPAGENVELKMRAYLDETRDIPALVISHALRRLTRSSARLARKEGQFAPLVPEIRAECARYLRERHRAANGLDPQSGLSWNDGELDEKHVERWLQRAQEPLPLALPAGRPLELPAGPDERQRACARLQAEITRLEKRMGAGR